MKEEDWLRRLMRKLEYPPSLSFLFYLISKGGYPELGGDGLHGVVEGQCGEERSRYDMIPGVITFGFIDCLDECWGFRHKREQREEREERDCISRMGRCA